MSNKGNLKKKLKTLFPKFFVSNFDLKKLSWIENPCLVDINDINQLPYKAQEEFAELSNDLKNFLQKYYNEFRIGPRIKFLK